MHANEYVGSLVINDKLVNIGMDDAGQSYFIEFIENHQLKQESCGSYNSNYKDYAEYRLGDPDKCVYQAINNPSTLENCPQRGTYGWCDHCKFNNVKWYANKLLIDLGVIDRRGNLLDPFKELLMQNNKEI